MDIYRLLTRSLSTIVTPIVTNKRNRNVAVIRDASSLHSNMNCAFGFQTVVFC